MAKKRMNWTLMLIAGIALIALAVVILIISKNPINNLFNNNSNLKNTEKISITYSYQIRTIDIQNKTISMEITGGHNSLGITRQTNIADLTITGNGNIINLCKNIHSPEVNDAGSNNKVVYVTC